MKFAKLGQVTNFFAGMCWFLYACARHRSVRLFTLQWLDCPTL